MRFDAPWGRALKATTAVLGLVFVALVGTLAFSLWRLAGASATIAVAVAAVLSTTLVLAWALAPRAFDIEGQRLRIDRPLLPVEVPLARILAVEPLPDEGLRGSLKVAGSSGLFGYYGRFWSRRLGAYRLYATRRTGLVLVDTADERFVLSPGPRERFIEALRQRAPAASRAAGEAPIAPRPMPRRVRVWLALLVASVLLVVAAVFLASWAFSPRSAVIERGEVRIERALAAPVVIALSEVRRVERLAPELGRFRRVAGTALPGGARYGLFRSRELGDVHLYAWRHGPYVLLETVDGRVVVTPDDADAFVAAARAGLQP